MIFLYALYLTLIILSKKYLFLLIFVILLSIYFLYKKEKICFIFLIFLLIPLSKPLYNKDNINGQFICVESKTNYSIIKNNYGKFIVYENYNYLDIINIEGEVNEVSGFNLNNRVSSFKDYLNNKGIYQSIKINYSSYVFKSPFFSFIKHNEETNKYLEYVLFNNKDISDELFDVLKNNLLLPLFVVSGMHINLLYNLLNKKIKSSYSFIIIFVYLIFLQFQIPALRAFLLLIFKEINERNNYNISYFNLFILVYIIMLIINPLNIYNMSFILTFLCSFLLFFIEGSNFKKTLLLNLGILPLIISMNKKINIFGIFVSFLYSYIFKYFYIFSFLVYFLPFFDTLYLVIFKFITLSLFNFDNFRFDLVVGNMSLFILLIYYILYLLILYKNKLHLKINKNLIVVGGLLLFLSYRCVILNYQAIVFLDIGQGNATLIIDNDCVTLIDTGGSKFTDLATQRIIPYLNSYGINEIDNIIISHDDYDHCGALTSLQKHIRIKNIYNSCEYKEFTFKNLHIKNLNVKDYYIGDDNDESGVFYFDFLNKTYLIMSDVSKKIEYEIMENYPFLSCDYILIGHHGSKYSTAEDFIRFVKPRMAIISCGKNHYGHPHQQVLDTLDRCKVPYKRIDEDGSIYFNNLNGIKKYIN